MNRPWAEFKVGFGDPSGNYWLGNDLLSQLTADNRYKLKFDLQQNGTGNRYYAEYSTFRVSSEAYYYKLEVGGFSGNAGRDTFSYNNGQKFSTFDRDNDSLPSLNCAVSRGGGFWHKHCASSGVNSARSTGHFYWEGLLGGETQLQLSQMWLECKQ